MELSTYIQVLKRRKWMVIITLIVAVAVAVVASTQLPSTFSATATLRILTATSGSADYLQYDVSYAERLMNTYANVATSQPVLDELTSRLDLDQAPEVKVTLITNTELFQISVEHRDPDVARDAANTMAEILIAEVEARYGELGRAALDTLSAQVAQSQSELEQMRQDYETALNADYLNMDRIQVLRDTLTLREERYTSLLAQYERVRVLEELQAPSMSVVEPATTPEAPSQPKKPLIVGLAGLLGLVGGLALAFLAEALDTRIYSRTQFEALCGVPVLHEIPAASRRQRGGFFYSHSIQEESIRRLGISLFPRARSGAGQFVPQTILVISAVPGEGKSTIAANLGLAAAQSGWRTLVIDADVRRPTLHQFFDLPNDAGLSNLLAGEADLDEVIHPSEFDRLSVLTSGSWTPEFLALLGSVAMVDLRDSLIQSFDVILIDSPAFLAVADGTILASLVDSVLLVLRQGYVRRDAVTAVINQLADMKIDSIEIVLNCARNEDAKRYYRPYSVAEQHASRRQKKLIQRASKP